MDPLKRIQDTARFIFDKTGFKPSAGIVLGTGLGGLSKEIKVEHRLDYTEIPDFPQSTVEGHAGQFIFGTLGGKKVMAMKGRFHYYEGYTMEEVVLPVRVMKFLGIRHLLLSNASGGVNNRFKIGDVMVITDHINLFPENPLRGKNLDTLGPRFPDMSEPYDKGLIRAAKEIAKLKKLKIRSGVYAGLQGPALETPAEYSSMRVLGADTVGMSTVPEVIAARHMGLPCFAISIITDLGVPGKIVKVTHEEIQKVAEKSEPVMTTIMRELIRGLK
jgi:purine-nucleoside phosphorylase